MEQTNFDPAREPYRLSEIADACGMSWFKARYALTSLQSRASTREIVQPLDGERPMLFTARAADLLARQMCATRKKPAAKKRNRRKNRGDAEALRTA